MPPKEKYNRRIILEKAFELVREDGFEQLSARNIAKRMGCSTQPVYSSFNSTEEIEAELIIRTKAYAQSEILSHVDKESNFLSIGMGYYLFSQKEPALFRGLFINGGWKWNFSKEDPFFCPILAKMRKDSFLEDLEDDKLAELFRDMFIYTHGLAAQADLSDKVSPVDYVRGLLRKLGGILIVSAKMNNSLDIEKLMRRFHG